MEQRVQLGSSYRHRSGTTSTTCKEEERSASGNNLSVAKSMGHKSKRRAHSQWAEVLLAIAVKYKDYVLSSDQTS